MLRKSNSYELFLYLFCQIVNQQLVAVDVVEEEVKREVGVVEAEVVKEAEEEGTRRTVLLGAEVVLEEVGVLVVEAGLAVDEVCLTLHSPLSFSCFASGSSFRDSLSPSKNNSIWTS